MISLLCVYWMVIEMEVDMWTMNIGSSWENPIWFGKWRIYRNRDAMFNRKWSFVHDDFDGAEDAEDNRCGCAVSPAECARAIEELFEE